MARYVSILIAGLFVLLIAGAWRLRKRRAVPGPAAAGALHDMLNADQRAAVEVIVERRAAARDPEDRNGAATAGGTAASTAGAEFRDRATRG
jgi:hypothetical protein